MYPGSEVQGAGDRAANRAAAFRREEVNKAYRKLAVLLHPDKCVAPGSEDAFKAVVNARTALLKNIK